MAKRKTGQQKRHEYKSDLIINRPEALSSLRRGTELTITTIGWIAWILICRPILILFLWIMGLQFLYEHMVELGGLQDLIEFCKIYIYVILFIFSVIKGWNFYNRFRFRTKSRRSQVRPADNDEIDKFFKLSDQGSETIQRWKDIAIEFKDHDELRIYDATQKDQKSFLGHFKPM